MSDFITNGELRIEAEPLSETIDAHDLGIAGGYIIEQMMGEHIERLKAENAKLRELENIRILQVKHCEDLDAENTKLRTQLSDATESVGRMEERCAKLRELVRDYESLTAMLCNERECDGCPFDSKEHAICEHMRLVARLGELGIEVDG